MFPSFRPGGDYVLYQQPGGDPSNPVWNIWTVPVTGGKPLRVTRGINDGWGGLAYGVADAKRDYAYVSPMSNATFTGDSLWIGSWDLRSAHPARSFEMDPSVGSGGPPTGRGSPTPHTDRSTCWTSLRARRRRSPWARRPSGSTTTR